MPELIFHREFFSAGEANACVRYIVCDGIGYCVVSHRDKIVVYDQMDAVTAYRLVHFERSELFSHAIDSPCIELVGGALKRDLSNLLEATDALDCIKNHSAQHGNGYRYQAPSVDVNFKLGNLESGIRTGAIHVTVDNRDWLLTKQFRHSWEARIDVEVQTAEQKVELVDEVTLTLRGGMGESVSNGFLNNALLDADEYPNSFEELLSRQGLFICLAGLAQQHRLRTGMIPPRVVAVATQNLHAMQSGLFSI